MKPEFITFTGADDHTDLGGMAALASRYPIEWGILFSPKRQGSGRYPTLGFVQRLIDAQVHGARLRLSAHLCGQHSLDVMAAMPSTSMSSWVGACGPDWRLFERVQINVAHRDPDSPRVVARWARPLGATPILQCRGNAFPIDDQVQWLFDRSGGRGEVPTCWPEGALYPFDPKALIGYAGGIGPDNAAEVVAQLPHHGQRYWIDMQSKVRDDQDRFSLELCARVCRAIYGDHLNA